MFIELFNVIAPVLFIALIGYIWTKRGIEFPTDFVTRLNMNIGAPCLIFVGILKLGTDISGVANFMLASLVTITVLLFVSIVFVYVFKLPKRAYIIALSSTNSGNMGIPLSLFAFGEIGMSYGVAFFTVAALFQFTVAIFISHGNMNPTSIMRVTLIWGVLGAFFFILTDTSPPTWLMNTTTLLAGVTIPLMLLTLGSSLAQLKIIDAPKILSISVAKIAIGMTIGIYTAYLFGLQGVERNVLILQMSMPVAVFSYLLASKYGRNPDEVASLIFITTLITLISVPLMLIYLF